jgi:hypothetical protein
LPRRAAGYIPVVTIGDAQTPELRSIAERARRRQRLLIFLLLAISLAGGALGAIGASRFGHRHHAQHHHHSTLGLIAALVVRRQKGIFEATLVMGLPWRDRRAVAKAVRRGRPPADALLQTVGHNLAERMLRTRHFARAAYVILVLVQAVNALLPDRPSWFRYLSAAMAVLFVWALFYHRAVIAGARRYVERCAT